MEKLELSELKHPWMREELVDYLDGLANQEYQEQAWVKGEFPNGGYDELDYTIHFLYDDTNLGSNPYSEIGFILISADEAEKILTLVRSIDSIFNMYGLGLDDKDYIEKPEWSYVVAAATVASEYLKRASTD